MGSPDRLLVAPYGVEQYRVGDGIFTNRRVDFAGYGETGTGDTGAAGGMGVKRSGANNIDRVTPTTYEYDFDSGDAAKSRMGDLGLGAAERMAAPGDSGSPIFNEGRIVGVENYVINFGESPISKYGHIAKHTRGRPIIDNLLVPHIDNAGAYDLVLDMQQQIYGLSDYASPVAGGVTAGLPENLAILVRNIDGYLTIEITGPESALNGFYYSAPAGNIKSLTIRGSSDNETIILDGPLGLSPAGSREVTIKGRGGRDIVRINGLDRAPTTDKYGTITVDGGAMSEGNELYIDDTRSGTDNTYDITSSYVVRRGLSPVNYSNFTTVGLQSGGGSDQVFFNGTTADVKYLVNANGQATQDKCFVESGYVNDPLLEAFEYLKISGGTLKLQTNGMAVDEFHQTGGTLDGAAKLSAAKVMSWSGGTMQGTGVTAALAGSMATITAGTLNTRTVTLAGTTDWDGSIGGGGGRIENSGYLRVGGVNRVGTATLAGTYAQTSAGKLELDLGSAPVGGHDTLFASENLTLGGELSLVPSAGSANVPALEPKHYSLVRNTGPNATAGAFANYANGQRVTLLNWKYDYSDRYADDGDAKANDVHLSPAPGSVGNYVWLDASNKYPIDTPVPNPLPLGNGVQDSDEVGYQGVTVRLQNEAGQQVAVTVSGQYGAYSFGSVAPGKYRVKFDLPADVTGSRGWVRYSFTVKDAQGTGTPESGLDSDADAAGLTDWFTVAPGEAVGTIDAGVVVNGTEYVEIGSNRVRPANAALAEWGAPIDVTLLGKKSGESRRWREVVTADGSVLSVLSDA